MKSRDPFVLRFLDEVVSPLADEAYQERVWGDGVGPEVDSYDETIDQFYYFYEAFERGFTGKTSNHSAIISIF